MADLDRGQGNALAVCGDRIAGSLPRDLACSGTVAIAYHLLWAIGNGHVPTADQIVGMHHHIRTCVMALGGSAGADIRILYGGSITADNASQVLALAEMGGVLIGGASLLAVDFDVVLGCVPKSLTDRG